MRRGHRLWLLFAGLLCLVVARWATVDTSSDPRFCVDGTCGGSAPLVPSLVPERPTAWLGLTSARWLGLVPPSERARIGPVFAQRFDHLAEQRSTATVNALLLRSNPDRVRALVSPAAPGSAVLVFLHGYGGLLTPYLSTLRQCRALDPYTILAPALSLDGDWGSARGRAVVTRTLATWPDPTDDAVLVGLSNGAIGVTDIAADPELAGRFRAIVAVEGLGSPDWHDPPVRGLHVIAAVDDVRNPLAHVRDHVATYRSLGADVVLHEVPGDHLAFFDRFGPICQALAHIVARPPAAG